MTQSKKEILESLRDELHGAEVTIGKDPTGKPAVRIDADLTPNVHVAIQTSTKVSDDKYILSIGGDPKVGMVSQNITADKLLKKITEYKP